MELNLAHCGTSCQEVPQYPLAPYYLASLGFTLRCNLISVLAYEYDLASKYEILRMAKNDSFLLFRASRCYCLYDVLKCLILKFPNQLCLACMRRRLTFIYTWRARWSN